MSRLGTVQPGNHLPLIARLAEADGVEEQDYHERLSPQSAAYDPDLQWRVLTQYVDHLCGLLTRVGEAGCDLVLLPECTLPLGGPYPGGRDHVRAACERAEPYWLERIAPLARRYSMLIASSYYRSAGGRLYNDAVLMDERGEVAGIYHKVHLPCPLDWEICEASLFTPGDEYPVFDTTVGKVGFQICYDIDFPEGARCLALNGADVILHPTVGYAFPDEEEVVGEARLRTRATDNSVALVYSNFGPSVGRSAIYAPNGNQLACCGRGSDVFAIADLDLRAPRTQEWGIGRHDHREQLARKRRPDTYGILTDPQPPLLHGGAGPNGRLYEYPPKIGLP